MSKLFNTIKKFYDKGIYNKDDVKSFVVSEKITEGEYEKIVGEKYAG